MGFAQHGHGMIGLGGRVSATSAALSRARTRAKRACAAALRNPKWRHRTKPFGNTCCRKRRRNSCPFRFAVRRLPLWRSVQAMMTWVSVMLRMRAASSAVFWI